MIGRRPLHRSNSLKGNSVNPDQMISIGTQGRFNESTSGMVRDKAAPPKMAFGQKAVPKPKMAKPPLARNSN